MMALPLIAFVDLGSQKTSSFVYTCSGDQALTNQYVTEKLTTTTRHESEDFAYSCSLAYLFFQFVYLNLLYHTLVYYSPTALSTPTSN